MEDESQTGLKSESGGKGSEEEGKRPEEGEGDSDSEEDILVYSQHRMGGDSISLLRNADCSPQTQSPVFDKHTRHRATSSASFSFSFSTHLLPLTNSLETVRHSVPTLNTTSAIALVVSSQIGSGIFSSPGILSQNCGSPGASLIVWTLAGILAWTGASSFAELGGCYSTLKGQNICVGYCISYTAFKASPSESAKAIPIIITKLVAILIMLTICFINGLSAKAGKHFPIILTLIKILSLLFIIIMALIRLIQGSQSHNFESANVFRNSSVSPSDLASALYSGLWAYDGWDSGNYIAGELKRATKTLPIVIHSSMGIVLTLMILTNWSYLIVLPMEVVTQSNTIGLEFGRVIFGPIGSFVFSLIVAFACFGALNSEVSLLEFPSSIPPILIGVAFIIKVVFLLRLDWLVSLLKKGFIIAGLPFYYLTTNKELRQFGFSKLKLFDLNSYKSSSGRDNNLSSFKALDTQDDDDPEDDDVNDHHGQETPVQK
ncbi:hypothetical protein Pst134EA_007415 [Puccinia striiformis f. sp. tritici]|uniref:hypothetical protein n=1 Tax=Puccinia striiformis f. sp. tritici TaxID=168172 RepID=UPI0020073BA8|nr:hypothetical protein Pst134EA_007415 [Puccinia striiformis f. sp. tritici]KAH9470150.1 hypothetical protein Pst134EA_007415 [Puccinia striiformis f. sp. tritici]